MTEVKVRFRANEQFADRVCTEIRGKRGRGREDANNKKEKNEAEVNAVRGGPVSGPRWGCVLSDRTMRESFCARQGMQGHSVGTPST